MSAREPHSLKSNSKIESAFDSDQFLSLKPFFPRIRLRVTTMRHHYIVHSLTVLAVLLAILLFTPTKALAHRDTMDGPVVKAAERPLATRKRKPGSDLGAKEG